MAKIACWPREIGKIFFTSLYFCLYIIELWGKKAAKMAMLIAAGCNCFHILINLGANFAVALHGKLVRYWTAARFKCTMLKQCAPRTVHRVLAAVCSLVWISINFTHLLQSCFTDTGAIIWLPQCQWSNPERYGWTTRMHSQRTDNINTIKQTTKPREYFMGHTLRGNYIIVAYRISSDILVNIWCS